MDGWMDGWMEETREKELDFRDFLSFCRDAMRMWGIEGGWTRFVAYVCRKERNTKQTYVTLER